jgi:hypothetical protein
MKGAFLVEPYNVEDLKSKIEILLSNPKLLENSDLKSEEICFRTFQSAQHGNSN